MDYSRIYREFIADRLTKQPTKPTYFERHHIVPSACGGSDDESNLIDLTAEDHIHAHILLARIHGGPMWAAIFFMTKKFVGRGRRSRTPTKKEILLVANAKKAYAMHCRGENHPMYGRKHADSTKEKMSKAQSRRGRLGLHWSQMNPELLSGDNHWTKKTQFAEKVDSLLETWKANLRIASEANRGENNPVHRPDVSAKLKKHFDKSKVEKTGLFSAESQKKSTASKRTPEYRAAASARKSGEKHHNFGKFGALSPNARKVLCVETGKVFPSVADAVAFCGGDVTKAARTGVTAGGYHWKRMEPHPADGRIMKNG